MSSNTKITSEIMEVPYKALYITELIKHREQFIAFANFAKSYRSDRKVKIAFEQWIEKQ